MSYLKPTPRFINHGVDDKSARQLPLTPEQQPQHLPLVFLLSELSEKVSIASGAYLKTLYGDQTLDNMSKFYNHQSVLASYMLEAANQCMVVPIKMPNAKKSSLRLGVEVTATTVTGSNGLRKNVLRLVWHATEIPAGEYAQGKVITQYRAGTTRSTVGNKRLGILVDNTGREYQSPSIYLPILDFEPEARGEYGNRLGIAFEAPMITDNMPTDDGLAERLNAFIFRMTLYKRNPTSVTPTITRNRWAETSSDFVFKPNAVDTRSGLAMFFAERLSEDYSDGGSDDLPPRYPPFHQPGIYQDNIETLLMLIGDDQTVTATALTSTGAKDFTVKGLFKTQEETRQKMYSINFLTGKDYYGDAYPNLLMEDSYIFGGISFGRDSVIYARGGSDGFPTNSSGTVDEMETLRLYDQAVRNWCEDYNEYNPLFDSAIYPFNMIYDSGFSMDTKMALLKPMSVTKRVITVLSTQSVADYGDNQKTYFKEIPPNTAAQEIAIASRLNSAARLYPESVLYGTETCRVAIVGRCGILRDARYRGYLPLSISLAHKLARYAGAGDGYMKREYAPDSESGRIDTLFKNINITYQPTTAYDESWSAGMIWVQNFDRTSVFFPAYQTVYSDSTSVLDSLLFVLAATYVTRVCEHVWRILVGNGLYGKMKFTEVSDQLITEMTQNRFDSRYDVVPNTYYTSGDEQRGYSWTTKVAMYADVNRLVNQFNVESHRRES